MKRPTLIVAFAAAALLALLLTGCGGGDNSSNSNSNNTSVSGNTSVTSATEPAATAQVNLPPSFRFDPAVLTVAAGTTVTWTNNDTVTHNVKVEDGDVMIMKPGESVSFTFDTPGTFNYICTFHPDRMQGQVIVTGS